MGDPTDPKPVPARSIFNTLAIAAYSMLALAIILLQSLMPVNPLAWAINLPLLAVSAAIQFTVVKKGCSTGFVLWFVTTFIALIIFLLNYVPQ